MNCEIKWLAHDFVRTFKMRKWYETLIIFIISEIIILLTNETVYESLINIGMILFIVIWLYMAYRECKKKGDMK